MDPNDFIEIKRLCEIKVADMVDKSSAQDLIRKYIDNGASYCLTCDPQIRQMFLRLRNWAEANNIYKNK